MQKCGAEANSIVLRGLQELCDFFFKQIIGINRGCLIFSSLLRGEDA